MIKRILLPTVFSAFFGSMSFVSAEVPSTCTLSQLDPILKAVLPVTFPESLKYAVKARNLVGQEMSQATGEMIYEYKVVVALQGSEPSDYDDVTLFVKLSDVYSSNKQSICTLKGLKAEASAE